MNMLSPKKTKFRKQFKGRIHGTAKGNFSLNYASAMFKALEKTRSTKLLPGQKEFHNMIKGVKQE